jgi:hypothetical protein
MEKNALGFKVWCLQTRPKKAGKRLQQCPPGGPCVVWQKMWVLICKILEVRCKRMHWGLRFGVCNKAKKIKGRKRAAVPPRGGGLNGVKKWWF